MHRFAAPLVAALVAVACTTPPAPAGVTTTVTLTAGAAPRSPATAALDGMEVIADQDLATGQAAAIVRVHGHEVARAAWDGTHVTVDIDVAAVTAAYGYVPGSLAGVLTDAGVDPSRVAAVGSPDDLVAVTEPFGVLPASCALLLALGVTPLQTCAEPDDPDSVRLHVDLTPRAAFTGLAIDVEDTPTTFSELAVTVEAALTSGSFAAVTLPMLHTADTDTAARHAAQDPATAADGVVIEYLADGRVQARYEGTYACHDPQTGGTTDQAC